jgi:hypothetical protein
MATRTRIAVRTHEIVDYTDAGIVERVVTEIWEIRYGHPSNRPGDT